MKIKMCAFVILVVLATTPAIQGDVLQNEANEFFVGFGNDPQLPGASTNLIVSTSSQDTVKFAVDSLSDFTYSGTVSLGSPANVVIPQDFIVTNDSISQRQKGIHVKAEGNKTIAVFGMNEDVYLALPCNHLPVMQYEYYAVNYHDPQSATPSECKPFVLLVGCENYTTINTAVSKFTLNRLETHLMIDAKTGTRVVTDKPIAFFSGNQCAQITQAEQNSPDHLIEHIPPTSTWGTFFLGSTGVDDQYGDTISYRILAAQDKTVVTVNCNSSSADPSNYTITTGGTYHDFKINHESLPNTLCVIEANNPVLVMEFISIFGSFGCRSFMSLLPSVDQYNNHYSLPFGKLNPDQYENYVTISVLPQYFDKKKIYLDNSIVSKPWLSVKCLNGTICGYATTVSGGRFLQHLDSNASIGAIALGTTDSYPNYFAYGCPAGFHVGSIDQLVSSSTSAPTSSAKTLLSTTLQPVLTSKAPQLSSAVAFISSPKTLLSTPQPVLTSKAPQPTYLSTLHFHTLHTVLSSSSQYKPTTSPEPAGSMTPELPSVTANTTYQKTPVPMHTPSVSPTPTDPQPIAVGVLLEVLIPVIIAIVAPTVCTFIACFPVSSFRKGSECHRPPNYGACTSAPRTLLSANGPLDEEFGDLAKEFSDLPSSVHDPEQRPEPADNTHRDEAVQSRRLTEDDLFPLTNMLRPAAPKWKEIGGALGIINSDLSIMEHDPMLIPKGVIGYFREMLSTWLKWAPPNHPWPTIQDLVDAVRNSGHEDLAVKLQNYK